MVQMEIDGELVQDDMDDDCPLIDAEDDVDGTDRSETEEDLHVEDQQVNNDEHPAPDSNGEQITTERSLRTKFATALSKVFGTSEKLHKLDKIRYRLKKYTKNTNLVSKHRDLMASFKQDLELKLQASKRNLKQYESEQYSTHHQLPSLTDLRYREQLQSIKFITKLLKSSDFCI